MNSAILKLMIVDDKLAEREGIKRILDWESIGIQIVGEAENGQEGIEKAKLLKPDIIIADIVMPQKDGFKMFEEIKCFLPDIKIIFISCYDNFNFVKTALNVNAMGYVLKPIVTGELLDTICKVSGIHLRELQKKKEDEEIKRRLMESLPVLKEQFLKDILFGVCKNEDDLWERNNFLSTGLFPGQFSVLLLELDDYYQKTAELSEENKQMLSLKIREFLSSIKFDLHVKIHISVTSMDKSRFAIILNFHSSEECASNEITEKISGQIKKAVNSSFNYNVTMSISNRTTQILHLHHCYQQCLDALKFKFYLGTDQIIYYSDIYHHNKSLPFQNISMSQLQQDLKYLIMTGNLNEIDQFITNLFAETMFGLDNQYVQYMCLHIISSLQIHLFEMNESLRNIFEDEASVFQKLLRFETIIDLRQWLKNIIWAVSSYLSKKNSTRNIKIIMIIKDFIRTHYNENITINEIAQSVYLSPSYANFIFKKETGYTLIEYLTKIRIDKAKELLKNSLLKVYEIAEEVGYNNTSYFSSVFKENVGMTPLEYRSGG